MKLLLIFALSMLPILSTTQVEVQRKAESFTSKDPAVLRASFRRYFKEAGGGIKGYLKGKHSGDRALMLQSAFEELHATLFLHHVFELWRDGRGVVKVSKLAKDQANQLIGFFTCALRQEPPQEWKNGLLTAVFRDDLYLGHDQQIKFDGTVSNTKVMYRQAENTPSDKLVEDICKQLEAGPERAVSLAEDAGKAYVVDYDRNGDGGHLQCYDLATKTFIWESTVVGFGTGIIAGLGANQHFVFVRLNADEVLVYGVHSFGLYVEVFSRSNGKCLARCASTLWGRHWKDAEENTKPSRELSSEGK